MRRWGWVSRELFEASEARARWAESQIRAAEELLMVSRVEAEMRVRSAQTDTAAARAESKLLIDRIVQMSGQPPIFNSAPSVAPPTTTVQPGASTSGSDIPAPETRTTFADVHRQARKAIKDGTIHTLTGAT